MNQKHRVWNRVKAYCASASLSGEAGRVAFDESSFIPEFKSQC